MMRIFFIISQVVPLMLTGALAQQSASTSGNPSAWSVEKFASTISDPKRREWFSVGVFDPNYGERSLAAGAGPAWSPDGRRIAFCSGEDELRTYSMFLVRGFSWSTTRDGTPLPWGESAIHHLKGLIVQSTNYRSISVVNVDGSGLKKIAEAKSGQGMCEPSWSPEGTQIAYTIYNLHSHHSSIYVMDQDGSHSRLITEGYRPRWSPDGRQLTFFRAKHGPASKSSIWVVNSDGTNLRRLTDDKAVSWTPTWTADGKIMFASNRQGASAIYEINPDGTGLRKIAAAKDYGLEGGLYVPEPSPDGKLVLVEHFYLGVDQTILLGIGTKSVFRLANAGVIGADVAVRWTRRPIDPVTSQLPNYARYSPYTSDKRSAHTCGFTGKYPPTSQCRLVRESNASNRHPKKF